MPSRWIIFNVVGVIGFGVQLGAIATLTAFGWPLPIATFIAVELALLHNFAWHQRWTWRDRPSGDARETLNRLWRFHAANGLVSLFGNVFITTAAAGAVDHYALPWTPLVANMIATLACSLVNYAAGEKVVFRASLVLFALLTPPGATVYAEQPARAVSGWDRHVVSVEKRFWDTGSSFFALDARSVARWRERARSGEVVLADINPPGIEDGKLHHWAGAIYIPRMTVDQVVNRLLEQAGRESTVYEEVTASKLLARDGDRVRVYMRLFRDAGPVEATYNSEHAVEYRRFGTRAVGRSLSTKIAELDNPGTAREREKAPNDDSGFLWRLNAYWRYEQLGDGVLIECESVSLSRSVPFLIRPIANPIVDRIARESLRNTLHGLRRFLAH